MSSDKKPLIEQDLNGKKSQVLYGKMAVANGGLIGKFPGNSQIRDFLPQAYSDYIYSIIIEEMGLIGGGFVLFLYILLMFRVLIIFRQSKNTFPALLMLGVTMLIVFQALINMAVGVDLIPVTGQPLPLISRGGTSTLITCGYFGIILSVSRSAMIDEQDYDENHRLGDGSPDEEPQTEPVVEPTVTTAATAATEEAAKTEVAEESAKTEEEEEEYTYTDLDQY